jgi:quercetin dioxygenase-like cupin family protein
MSQPTMPTQPRVSTDVRTATGQAVVLDAAAIERLPLAKLHGLRAAETRVLWTKGRSLAGIIEVAPGEELAEHAHPEAHHHAWVLAGEAVILGVHVSAGSYIHIPAGMPHAVERVGPQGLRMLYLFQIVG